MKPLKYLSYYLITAAYSILIGIVGWSFLYVVNTGIHFLWIGHEGSGGLLLNHPLFIFPFIWSISMVLAFIYNNYEVIPRPGIKYAKEFKANQRVVYKDFVLVYALSLVPILLGSSVGPEAALIGLFFMLSSYLGDATDRFEQRLGVVIKEDPQERFIDNLKTNKLYLLKIVISYGFVVATLLELLNKDRFPAFNVQMPAVGSINFVSIIQVLLLIIVGHMLAKFYQKSEPIIEKQFERVTNRYLKMTITAILLSLSAYFFPLIILSGEATLHILVENPLMIGGLLLVAMSLLKVLITHVCISGDLRGGHIFPIIYSAFLMGGGLSQLFGINPTLAIASVTVAMTMTIFSNTVAIFMLLALFFPLRILSLLFIIVLIIGEKRAADHDRKEI